MRPTIKDVAMRAGVSAATVSRILAGADAAVRINPATRARVLLSSQEIGYTPDARASSLRSQRSRLVGVIVRDITQAFPAVLVAVLDTVLKEHGHELILAQGQIVAGVDRFPEAFDRHRVSGVIFVGTPHETIDTSILTEYSRRLDRRVVGLAYSGALRLPVSVKIDDRLGIQIGVDHLTACGHRRIGFVGAPVSLAMGYRLTAFEDYASSVPGVAPIAVRVERANARTGGEAMLSLLSQPDPPTAVMFANDDLAIGGLLAAHQSGRSVPDDVSIIGFDDIPLAADCWPPLTTIRQPVRSMAEEAVRSLVGLIQNAARRTNSTAPGSDGHVPEERIFSPELMVRGSAAPRAQSLSPTSNRADQCPA